MCYHSYDRLIDLAQRTGDRLIVHDPIEGRDIVIMDVSEYEKLIDRKDELKCKDRKNIREMSSDQMLDQINRDIAIWRAEKEEEDEWEREMTLEDEFAGEPPFDPFSEQDYYPSEWHNNSEDWMKKSDPWHSTGSVLGGRYNDFNNGDLSNFEEDDWEDENDDDFDFDFDTWNNKEKIDCREDNGSNLDFADIDEEIKIEDIPFDSDFKIADEDLKNIPLSDSPNFLESWKEEPLGDDEPVFYEEPV